MSRHQSIDNRRRFEKAISKASEKAANRVTPRWSYVDADGHTETFVTVLSATTEGEGYGVRIHTRGNATTVTCNCECGMHGTHVCWHMAAALLKLGYLREAVAA